VRLSLRALSGLGITGLVFLLGGLAAFAVAYTLFVAEQTRYLESRNFRLLQSLALQTESAIRNEVRVFESQAREFRPDSWQYLRERRYAGANLPERLQQIKSPRSSFGLGPRDETHAVHVTLTSADRQRAPSTATQEFWLPINAILEPVFKPKVRQNAFDTVVLATSDGEVWFASGSREAELRSSRLDAFVPEPEQGQQRKFADLVKTAVVDVVIGGVDYKLFAQPCCRFASNAKSLMVAGLVEASSLSVRSRAIPTTFVKLAVLGVLGSIVLWPFLKFALRGGRQRVRTLDVLQIGLSSVAGLGLLTITALDAYAYRRLNRQHDQALAALAESIKDSFTSEMTAVARQLSCLEDVTMHFQPVERDKLEQTHAVRDLLAKDIRVTGAHCEGTLNEPRVSKRAVPAKSPSASWPHPYFESFALIAADGAQDVKLATTKWVSSRISVKDRRYFTDVQSGMLWKDARFCPKGKGCALESVISWTTGEPQAVLSTTASNKSYKVAALSVPLRSLAQPVLPPGFAFAVIDASGTVFFHSDSQRNGFENFFKESDDNRRLRAQVLAHSVEPLDLQYWGAPYRAYVRPLDPFGLSVVTLFQKERTWALDREWLVVALLFYAVHILICGIAMLLTLVLNPSWVWPDPARVRLYPYAVALNTLMIVAALLVAVRGQGTTLAWCAYVVPVVAWIGTFMILRVRPTGSPEHGTLDPVRPHRALLVVLLIVSSIVPSVLLFLTSYRLHSQSYVKHVQFRVARALVQREDRLAVQYSPTRGAQRSTLLARIGSSPRQDPFHDLYFDFFYGTCLSGGSMPLSGATKCAPELGPVEDKVAPPRDSGEDGILALLEAYLPYYSESSIEWRELLHDRAGDDSWQSRMSNDGVLSTTLPATADERVTLSSTLPGLFDRAPGEVAGGHGSRGVGELHASADRLSPARVTSVWSYIWGPELFLFALAAVVLAVAWKLVEFVTRHVFLTGVSEPLWSSSRLTADAGDNLFVVCDADMKAQQIIGAQPLKLGAIGADPAVEVALRRELIRLGRVEPGSAVLIDDFDQDLEDAALMQAKLRLLERLAADRSRVVVVLSQLSPMALADNMRRSGEMPDDSAERWDRLMHVFVLTDWRGASAGRSPTEVRVSDAAKTAGDRELAIEPATARQSRRPSVHVLRQLRMKAVRDLLASEGAGHPMVNDVCRRIEASPAIRRGDLSYEQVLEEISEQAAACYRRLWCSCSEDEKIVLVHIAQDGLTHSGARPVVRKLLARRLVQKAPELRLMNTTFQSFVLSSTCSAEVSRLETATGPSVWDALRLPLGIIVTGTALFLIATQRELYEAILGATTAAAVSVPTIVKAVGTLSGRRPAGAEKLA
jgi:hypothetical protein